MKLLFSTFLVFNLALASAQSLSPEVISTAGSTMSDGTNSITWTMGELLSSSNNLTNGFQQGTIYITAIDVEEKNALSINVYPNPTIDIVQLKFSEVVENCQVAIYSMDGKLVYSDKILSDSVYKLSLATFPSGTYSLKLSGTITAHYQLVKSN